MVRIWFSVCGDGYGHALRSKPVIDFLIEEGHDIMITAYGKAYAHFKKLYGDKVKKVLGDFHVYRNNAVMKYETLLRHIVTVPFIFTYNSAVILSFVNKFKPQIIVSDFEAASHYAAKFFGIPCINFDNIHAITESAVQLLKRPWHIVPAIRYLHPKAKYNLITYFCSLPLKNTHSRVIPPVLRKEVLNEIASQEEHVLVYQTSKTNKKMLPILKSSSRTFIVYGMGEDKQEDNIIFKKFSESGFIKDLASAKYAIVNGGFTTISEALYFKKPVLSIPICHQFEQEFNAYKIKECGFGSTTKRLTKSFLAEFEKKLPQYEHAVKRIPRWDNNQSFAELAVLIKELVKKK